MTRYIRPTQTLSTIIFQPLREVQVPIRVEVPIPVPVAVPIEMFPASQIITLCKPTGEQWCKGNVMIYGGQSYLHLKEFAAEFTKQDGSPLMPIDNLFLKLPDFFADNIQPGLMTLSISDEGTLKLTFSMLYGNEMTVPTLLFTNTVGLSQIRFSDMSFTVNSLPQLEPATARPLLTSSRG